MNFAYGWAFSKPVRKVYYNITITGLSVAVALIIGTIELRLDPGREARHHQRAAGLDRRPGPQPRRATPSSALFVLTWVVALAVWRFGRIEEKWTAGLQESHAGGRPRRLKRPAGRTRRHDGAPPFRRAGG